MSGEDGGAGVEVEGAEGVGAGAGGGRRWRGRGGGISGSDLYSSASCASVGMGVVRALSHKTIRESAGDS